VSASARRGLRGREGTHSRARENEKHTNVSSIVSDEIYKLVTPTKTVKASVVLLVLLAARVPYKY